MIHPKITKPFFRHKKNFLCTLCKDSDGEGDLNKEIHIIFTAPYQEDDFTTFILWRYDIDKSCFVLITDAGNLSPKMNEIIPQHTTISSISDVKDICLRITKLGYQLDEIRLFTLCYDCRCSHRFELAWVENKTLMLEEQGASVGDYSVYNNYKNSISCIGYKPDKYRMSYSYNNFLVKFDLQDYKNLENKIKQTLLLG